MYNPNGTSILEHALEIARLARPLVEAIARKDRDAEEWSKDQDLASQVRRAIMSLYPAPKASMTGSYIRANGWLRSQVVH